MTGIEAFSLDHEDRVILTRIKGMYPRMKFSRLINMVLRQWLEDKEAGKKNIFADLEELYNKHKDVNK